MPDFTKKNYKFGHKGMQWNQSIDTIPEGQICYGRNIRSTKHETITQRPGLTNFATIGASISFLHSISVLNNYNPALAHYSKVFILSGATPAGPPDVNKFFVGDTAANLTSTATVGPLSQPINPVLLPNPGHTTFTPSGNPVTMVDMAPVGTNTGWKYIGDASMNFSLGYYPGDFTTPGTGPNKGMARAVTMGMTPPVNQEVPFNGGDGPLVGNYQWAFAYRNMWTGARSNPSAATRVSLTNPYLNFHTDFPGYASFSTPQTPIDPQTGNPDQNILVDIYRWSNVHPVWAYIGTEKGGTPFNDNIPDTNILTAPVVPSVTDPNNPNNVPRPNLYRPFVTQANAVYSTTNGTISLSGHGTFLLTANGGDVFDMNWIQGSPISVNNKIYSIYQVISPSTLELKEDATGILTPGSNVPWATQTGNLVMGQAMTHIWGPYGTGGTGGAFVFGCGGSSPPGVNSTVDAGTLYWCNGNDPDSTDIANSLLITSPSEPLRGGCIYDGTPFVWSTERMFRIYPGAVAGQFTVQEVPGSKGIWAEFSLTVQTTGIADQSVTWVGKDGVYDWSTSAGLVCLTDRDLYPFFPHDNQLGLALATLFPNPFGSLPEPVQVNAPDYSSSQMRYHRLCWFMGELFYDFPSVGGNFNTLVFDTKQTQGWVSLDQYSNGAAAAATKPVCRGIEIAANNLKLGVGPVLLDYTGTTDAGTNIPCRLVTRQDDLGDARIQKLWGDYMFDAAPGSAITITPLADYAQSSGLVQTTGATVARAQRVYPTIANGLGNLSLSFGMNVTWTGAVNPVTLFQYEVAYVPKPELTSTRPTDKTDDGYLGAKYLRGICIEANTFGSDRTMTILVDDNVVGTVTVNTLSQLEVPFSITPAVGSEFQVQGTDSTNLWELFSVRWVWEKWPDLDKMESAWMDLGTPKPKYLRGFTIPISGPNSPLLSFNVVYDDAQTYTTWAIGPVSATTKSTAQYSFIPPILAHELKLVPTAPCRIFYDEIKWDAEEWPESAQLYGPVENLERTGAKYVRGFDLPMETGGNPVGMSLLYDSETGGNGITKTLNFAPVSTDPLSKNVFNFTPTPPIIAHELQVVSDGSARFWYGEIQWDSDPWPEYDIGRTPWLDNGTPGAKFVRGITMPVDTGGLPVLFDIYTDTGQDITFGPFTTLVNVKSAIYCGFQVPLVFHEFQISPRSNCRIWYQEIKWDADPWPEAEVESSSWGDAGYQGAKFMQGLVMPLDTNGTTVMFDLLTDVGTFPVGPFTTIAGQKTTVAYSFPVPFICHNLLLTPRSTCRVWYDEIKWVWEPEPELVTTYTTQPTDHDLTGYNYLFDCYIAYIGSADAPTFTVTTEYGSITYTLPVSNAVYTRAYLLLNPQKSKWKSYSIQSSNGIRLFLKDCEVRAKNWTDKGNYPSSFTSHMPFGDMSRIVGAKI